jgi:hypothetical protein
MVMAVPKHPSQLPDAMGMHKRFPRRLRSLIIILLLMIVPDPIVGLWRCVFPSEKSLTAPVVMAV